MAAQTERDDLSPAATTATRADAGLGGAGTFVMSDYGRTGAIARFGEELAELRKLLLDLPPRPNALAEGEISLREQPSAAAPGWLPARVGGPLADGAELPDRGVDLRDGRLSPHTVILGQGEAIENLDQIARSKAAIVGFLHALILAQRADIAALTRQRDAKFDELDRLKAEIDWVGSQSRASEAARRAAQTAADLAGDALNRVREVIARHPGRMRIETVLSESTCDDEMQASDVRGGPPTSIAVPPAPPAPSPEMFETTGSSQGGDDLPDDPGVLRAILFAQRWDIAGLRQQQDDSDAEIARLKAEAAALRAQANATAWRVAQTTANQANEALGRAVRAVTEHPDRLGIERELILALGLFDAEWYARQAPEIGEATPVEQVRHYLETGETAGLQPHPLFDPPYYRRQLGAAPASATSFLVHYLIEGWRRDAAPHPLFDLGHYQRLHAGEAPLGVNPLLHFIAIGAADGRPPHPLFDTAHLRQRYPDVFWEEADPIRRFLCDPQCRDFSPSLYFDVDYYLARYPDVRQWKFGPFLHFLMHGAYEGRDPHPLFSTEFYTRQVGGWAERSADPLSDFVCFGVAEGARPHPLFDGGFYLDRYSDVAKDRWNPLRHYLRHGGGIEEARSPHTLFDGQYYKKFLAGKELLAPTLLEDFLIRLKSGADPIDPNPLFSCQHYLQQHPDLRDEKRNPLLHYLEAAPGEGGDPHPLFDEQYYLSQCPEAREGSETLLEHYYRAGYKNWLSPHPLYDVAYIREQCRDLPDQGFIPLLNHVMSPPGMAAGTPQPNAWFDSISYNLIHQGGDKDAMCPLQHFVLAGGKAPTALSEPASLPDQLPADAAEFGLPSHVPAQLSSAHNLAQFLDSHPFYRLGGNLACDRDAGGGGRGIALYAVHAPTGAPNATHRALLRALMRDGYETVVINSTLAGGESFAAAACELSNVVMLRPAGARDFGSWLGAVTLLYNQLLAFDHVVFVNDSLLGPVAPLDRVWRCFRDSEALFWGLTDSPEQQWHIQSSFFVLRRAALTSESFLNFIARFEFPDDRLDVVRQGELGLSGALLRDTAPDVMAPHQDVVDAWLAALPEQTKYYDNLVIDAVFRAHFPSDAIAPFCRYAIDWLGDVATKLRRGEPENPQHVFWDILYQEYGYPFVKRDLLAGNPRMVPSIVRLKDVISTAFAADLTQMLADIERPQHPTARSVLRISPEYRMAWSAAMEGSQACATAI